MTYKMETLNHIVVKLGTSTLTQGTKKLSRRSMLEMARQLSQLHESGNKVILVTSGAIAAGREILNFPKTDKAMPFKQMLAAVGQVSLMQIWTEIFHLFGIAVGQVLLTRSDFSNRKRYLNVRDTLLSLLKHGVIPIINENDTVATQEIRVGDNDNLSALVANLVDADLLVLLTDQEGLFTADPRHNPSATLIPVVNHIDEKIFSLAGGSITGLGTGGMTTKIQAAQLAIHSGTSTVIASATIPDVLVRLSKGEKLGTLFIAETTPKESRKRWLLSEKPQGSLSLDVGAEQQVFNKGASLLPVGVTDTIDPFERGAVVQLISTKGQPIAVGISNYSSEEIQKIMGIKSDLIEECLGYTYGDEVVHRDNLALLRKNPHE